MNILFNDNLPTDLLTAFQIIKLLIEKGNLNLIQNKNSCQDFNYLSRKKLDKYIMRCNSWTTKSEFTYLHYIYQISSIQTLHTFKHPCIQQINKLILYNELPTQNGKQILHNGEYQSR